MELLGEIILGILLEVFLGTIKSKQAPRRLRVLLLSLLILPLSALFFHLGFALIDTRPNLFGYLLTTLAGVSLVGWAVGVHWIARTKTAGIPSASTEPLLWASNDPITVPAELTQPGPDDSNDPERIPEASPPTQFHEQQKKR